MRVERLVSYRDLTDPPPNWIQGYTLFNRFDRFGCTFVQKGISQADERNTNVLADSP